MRVTVLGGGLWGSALAQHVSRDGARTTVWEFVADVARRLQKERTHADIPGFKLRPGVRATNDLSEALDKTEVLLVVLPSSHLRATAARCRPLLKRGTLKAVVTASKGLERKTLHTMAEILEEELAGLGAPVYAVSGPSFAREVAGGVPTKLVLAGEGRLPTPALLRLFDGGPVRVTQSRDRRGVELGGALKNVMAIACGLADGLALGANTKAAIITEAMGEMERIVVGAGGDASTVRGLSGLGDLVLTGTSTQSRNRSLGEHLGGGEGLAKALKAVHTVAEGAESAEAAVQLAKAVNVRAPLAEAVKAILAGKRPPNALLKAAGF